MKSPWTSPLNSMDIFDFQGPNPAAAGKPSAVAFCRRALEGGKSGGSMCSPTAQEGAEQDTPPPHVPEEIQKRSTMSRNPRTLRRVEADTDRDFSKMKSRQSCNGRQECCGCQMGPWTRSMSIFFFGNRSMAGYGLGDQREIA